MEESEVTSRIQFLEKRASTSTEKELLSRLKERIIKLIDQMSEDEIMDKIHFLEDKVARNTATAFEKEVLTLVKQEIIE